MVGSSRLASALTFTGFPKEHWKQIASTNLIERQNKKIKRRSNEIGIFPNDWSDHAIGRRPPLC